MNINNYCNFVFKYFINFSLCHLSPSSSLLHFIQITHHQPTTPPPQVITHYKSWSSYHKIKSTYQPKNPNQTQQQLKAYNPNPKSNPINGTKIHTMKIQNQTHHRPPTISTQHHPNCEEEEEEEIESWETRELFIFLERERERGVYKW